mmetsp:Transcript_44140/g.116820  ORF Transcript_44140/g.116820 Transcript_44140/m.116820 type:complete len:242 (+) Transcript_44140:177-902(+)
MASWPGEMQQPSVPSRALNNVRSCMLARGVQSEQTPEKIRAHCHQRRPTHLSRQRRLSHLGPSLPYPASPSPGFLGSVGRSCPLLARSPRDPERSRDPGRNSRGQCRRQLVQPVAQQPEWEPSSAQRRVALAPRRVLEPRLCRSPLWTARGRLANPRPYPQGPQAADLPVRRLLHWALPLQGWPRVALSQCPLHRPSTTPEPSAEPRPHHPRRPPWGPWWGRPLLALPLRLPGPAAHAPPP